MFNDMNSNYGSGNANGYISGRAKIKVIGVGAFKFCRGLKSVHIPASVERIETDAFLNCYELEEVTSEEGLEFIGRHAFKNCKNIVSISFPISILHL